jgi:16S rRNA (cytosine967-C5)-methyltransferase
VKPHRNPRTIAAELLTKIEEDNAYAHILLGKLAESKEIKPADFPIVQRMVRGTLESKDSLDAILAPRLARGKTPPPFVRNLLRIGVYQLRFLDRVPHHLIVNESVDVIKHSQFRGLSGFVNAVLRQVIRDTETTTSAPSPLNHPQWMIDRWTREFGADEARAICEANNRPWSLFLRTNTLRTTRDELRKLLRSEGVESEPSPYATHCLIVTALPRTLRLQNLKSFQAGLFFVQDESSILVTELLAPQPHETVVDLCSAPGGKTCSIALQMQNTGKVIAVEINEKRLALVREACERLGITNVEFHLGDGTTYTPDTPVDAALLDVPCSGLGVIGRRADVRWNKEEHEIDDLLPLQSALLEHGATLIKPTGRLVYSTCTIEPAENEARIQAFLAKHSDYTLQPPPPNFPRDVVTDDRFLRTWPHRHNTAGAFGARLGARTI